MKCTCHPDDNPPRPCPQKYAYSECVAAAERAPWWAYVLAALGAVTLFGFGALLFDGGRWIGLW